MRADYLSLERAAGRSLVGLGLQLAMAVALLVYAVRTHDHAALSAALYVGLGVIVWLALAISFDLHRRERIEALEAENLAQQSVSSSVFEAGGQDFRAAARRLALMHKVAMPAVSLLLALGLLGLGWWRLSSGRTQLAPENFPPVPHGGHWWAMSVGLAVAFVGFAFARYMAGMAKQPVWANLRAGAAQAVGAALFGVALAVAHFVDAYGPDTLVRWLQVVLPGVMIALGVEILLNVLLDMYRPRRAGELPRPAMESRLLGYAAAPDRIAKSISDAINYQFGYDVSSTWFYRLLARSFLLLIGLGLLVGWGLSALVVVKPHQSALILRWGSVHREVGPGLHVKAPWPVDEVLIPVYLERDREGKLAERDHTTTGLRTVQLGTPPPDDPSKPILWTNEHTSVEVFMLVRPSSIDMQSSGIDTPSSGSDAAANDLAVVAMEIPMTYRVRDVEKYERLAPPLDRERFIQAIAQREAARLLATYSIDDLLGTGRPSVVPALRGRIEAALANINPDARGRPMGAGVEVVSLTIAGVHPPRQAAGSFERVVQAQQGREAMIEAARAQRTKLLTDVAGGEDTALAIVSQINELDRLGQGGSKAADLDAQRLKVHAMLDTAGGQAASAIAQAKAQRWQTHMGERARASRYLGQLASYRASPQLFMASLYFDAMRSVMADSRVIITDDSVPGLEVRTDLQDRDVGARIFDTSENIENKTSQAK